MIRIFSFPFKFNRLTFLSIDKSSYLIKGKGWEEKSLLFDRGLQSDKDHPGQLRRVCRSKQRLLDLAILQGFVSLNQPPWREFGGIHSMHQLKEIKWLRPTSGETGGFRFDRNTEPFVPKTTIYLRILHAKRIGNRL